MNETAQSRFGARCPGPMRTRSSSRPSSPDSMEPREKFVWSFFRRHNIKTQHVRPAAAPQCHHCRHRRYFDLLCAQVAASQAVTHPTGFLRVEKGATMEGARRPEKTMTGRRVEGDSHGYLCDIIRRGDTRPVTRKQCDFTRKSGELLAMDINDRCFVVRSPVIPQPEESFGIIARSVISEFFISRSILSISYTCSHEG